jgi:lipoprotein-releasing system ATP-binding protein
MMNEPVVRCIDLRKRFESTAETIKVIDGLDFELRKGAFVAITGKSGSGKSTLLSLIGGLDTPTSGTLIACGMDLSMADERLLSSYRSEKVGFVFQFHYLLKDFSALENVALPLLMRGMRKRRAKEMAYSMLETVGLTSRADHLPAKMSGGERQRVAIARALVNSPDLVLADEPTGNLDEVTSSEIKELLLSLPSSTGTSVLVVTHDITFANSADECYSLHEGKLRLR